MVCARVARLSASLSPACTPPAGRRVAGAIENCPNVLGTFTGHSHLASEDRLGQTWQFMTAAAHLGRWRYVKIHNVQPPKSLAVEGEPVV